MSADPAPRRPKPAQKSEQPARAPMFEVREQPLPNAPRPLRNARDPFEDLLEIGQRGPAPSRPSSAPREPMPLGRTPERTPLGPAREAPPTRLPERRTLASKSIDLQQADMLVRDFAASRAPAARPAAYAGPAELARGRPWLLLMIALVSLAVVWFASAPSKTIISSFGGSASNIAHNAGDALASVFKHKDVVIPEGQHAVVGAPTVSAQFIDQVLAHYGSPAQGSGATWVKLGEQYGIDPAYALAFFIHESGAGTAAGWAGLKPDGSSTHNVGNIICAGYDTCYGRFRDYASWEEGINDWYKLIANEYIDGRSAVTLEQIIPIYAPSFENEVGNYVQTVLNLADAWRQGVVQ